MAADLYGEARALGVALWDAGMPQWSKRIDDAIETGFTASEILMALRWTLEQLLESDDVLSPETARRTVALKEEISRVLR